MIQAAATRATAWRTVVSDYAEMTKPKVQTLLLFTTITTMEIAGSPPVSKIALTCLGGYLSAGGAGAVNHYYDRDIDAVMKRTSTRPIPAGRIAPRAALWYGIALGAASFALLASTVNLLAAALALSGLLGYVLVYTIWRRVSRSPWTTGIIGTPTRSYSPFMSSDSAQKCGGVQ